MGVGAIRHPTVGFSKRWEQRGTFTNVVGRMVGEWDQKGRYLGLILRYWDIGEGFGVDGEGSKPIIYIYINPIFLEVMNIKLPGILGVNTKILGFGTAFQASSTASNFFSLVKYYNHD